MNAHNPPSSGLLPAIRTIDCDSLFGYYSYHLTRDQVIDTHSQLLLLYGDNGSGKTTIVQLLFHLLSRDDARGHRTFLAQSKFKHFAVTFENGITLGAFRNDDLVGPYTLYAQNRSDRIAEAMVKTSEGGKVTPGDVDDVQLEAVFNAALPPSLHVYYLSDQRRLHKGGEIDSSVYLDTHTSRRIIRRNERRGDYYEETIQEETAALTVAPSLARAEHWLRRQGLMASSVGESTTTTIYADIVKRISRPSLGAEGASLDTLVTALKELSERSTSYATLGLSQPIPVRELARSLEGLPAQQGQVIAKVLEPYIDSIRSRLDAFAELQQRLSTFLGIVNDLYKRKNVRVTLSDGFQIQTDDGTLLDPSLLSSGEKHLLVLLCNVLVATGQPSVFIIDEPELSLNVKWQRDLVSALLALVWRSQVQFIMATHSIELLTPHEDCVLTLDDMHCRQLAKAKA